MADRSRTRSKILERLNNPELRCKTGCGFYGNPAWRGYCSVCYREVYLKQQRARAASQSREDALSGGSHNFQTEVAHEEEESGGKLKFNKFEEKKRFQLESKNKVLRNYSKRVQAELLYQMLEFLAHLQLSLKRVVQVFGIS